ncbi:hypothetical protein [Leptospira sp. GIMC2001]|uniref:hypothetical protein n=1 Tax=Leptospira sp. GIMC2001 TaxID=1513297 RepID=UPI00234A914A|nr:hypothetical protein [Leptospira sp. GIMC2001]WCL49163.1 hypothetical protein O4O04_18005 [Leptospira sp. GIMC2001]
MRVNLYSKAYGEITIQNLEEDPIVIRENGTEEIQVTQLSDGKFEFRITSQPTNHRCALVNPSDVYSAESILEINCFSVLSTIPPNGGILAPSESLVFVFSDSTNFNIADIDASFTSVNLEADSGPNFTLENELKPDDKIRITPAGTGWNSGVGKFVGYKFQNADGKPLAVEEDILFLTIASMIRYVSSNGNDANDGTTPSASFRNIQPAISDMTPCADSACLVLVEAGNYDAAADGDQIVLENGISIVGSYTAGSNFQERNTSARSSTIHFPSPPAAICGIALLEYCSPVFIPSSVTEVTSLEGFTIQSANSEWTYGVVSSGNPLLMNNTIRSGDTNGTVYPRTGGFLIVSQGNVSVSNSLIESGICLEDNSFSYGFRIDENSSGIGIAPELNNVTVNAGNCVTDGSTSIGLASESTGPAFIALTNINDSTFQAGDTNLSNGSSIGLKSNYGIELYGNNSFRSGNGSVVYGLSLSGSGVKVGISGSHITIETGNATFENGGILLDGSSILNANLQYATVRLGETSNTGSGSIVVYGISAADAGMSIEFNRITILMNSVTSTSGDADAIGIYSGSEDSASSITNSSIRMANVAVAPTYQGSNYGIRWVGQSDGLIANNLVYGGICNRKAGGILIENNGLDIRILHNTIVSGTADPVDKGFGLSIVNGIGDTEIRNNIFLNSPTIPICLNLDGIPNLTGAIQGNVFANCSIPLINSATLDEFNEICTIGYLGKNSCTTPTSDIVGDGILNFRFNNLSNPNLSNPFTEPFNFSPTSSTPCSIARLENFIGINDDRFQDSIRPLFGPPDTVSIGAIQYNGACTP